MTDNLPMEGSLKGNVSAIEAALADIWADVLDLSEVGPDDDFIGIGGDSVAATLCVIRMQEVFGVDMPMDALLTDISTVRGVARQIDRLL